MFLIITPSFSNLSPPQAHSNMIDLINEYEQYQNAGIYDEEDEYTEEYDSEKA